MADKKIYELVAEDIVKAKTNLKDPSLYAGNASYDYFFNTFGDNAEATGGFVRYTDLENTDYANSEYGQKDHNLTQEKDFRKYLDRFASGDFGDIPDYTREINEKVWNRSATKVGPIKLMAHYFSNNPKTDMNGDAVIVWQMSTPQNHEIRIWDLYMYIGAFGSVRRVNELNWRREVAINPEKANGMKYYNANKDRANDTNTYQDNKVDKNTQYLWNYITLNSEANLEAKNKFNEQFNNTELSLGKFNTNGDKTAKRAKKEIFTGNQTPKNNVHTGEQPIVSYEDAGRQWFNATQHINDTVLDQAIRDGYTVDNSISGVVEGIYRTAFGHLRNWHFSDSERWHQYKRQLKELFELSNFDGTGLKSEIGGVPLKIIEKTPENAEQYNRYNKVIDQDFTGNIVNTLTATDESGYGYFAITPEIEDFILDAEAKLFEAKAQAIATKHTIFGIVEQIYNLLVGHGYTYHGDKLTIDQLMGMLIVKYKVEQLTDKDFEKDPKHNPTMALKAAIDKAIEDGEKKLMDELAKVDPSDENAQNQIRRKNRKETNAVVRLAVEEHTLSNDSEI